MKRIWPETNGTKGGSPLLFLPTGYDLIPWNRKGLPPFVPLNRQTVRRVSWHLTGVRRARQASSCLVKLAALIVLALFLCVPHPAQAQDEAVGTDWLISINSWEELVETINRFNMSTDSHTLIIEQDLQRQQGSADLNIAYHNVTINLNGHSIDGCSDAGSDSGHRFIRVTVAGSLTITDNSEQGNGVIKGWSGERGGAFLVEGGGTLRINGGTISGNSATQGGAIAIDNATCTVERGTISDNSAEQGGAIFAEAEGQAKSILRISNGIICNNSATQGGGVYVGHRGYLFFEDGTIASNNAAENGGNLAVMDGGEASMEDGVLSTGLAQYGGGVAVCGGTFTMQGGIVRDNTASNGGGIVVLDGIASVKNASAYGNSCSIEGGGVYVGTQGRFEVADAVNISHNEKHSHNAKRNASQDVFLEVGAVITAVDSLDYSETMYVDVQDMPLENESRAIAVPGTYGDLAFACENPDYELYYESDEDGQRVALLRYIPEYNYEPVNSWADLAQKLRSLKKNEKASYKLERDLLYGTGLPAEFATRPLEIRKGAQVTIDLNGYYIDRGLSGQGTPSLEDSERCVYVSKGTLTIRDSCGGGALYGGCCRYGGGVFVADGTLALESGSITGNKAVYGGGVCVGMGTFELRGGSVTDNIGLAQALPCGGGVYVGDNSSLPPVSEGDEDDEDEDPIETVAQGTMTMTGGSVDHNKAAGWGAGVCASNGILTVTDGVIEHNVPLEGASQGGGGVFAGSGSTVDLRGCSVNDNELVGPEGEAEGAGVSVMGNSTVVLGDATITRNVCKQGGGGIMVASSDLTIDGAQICNNRAEGSGGGIMVRYAATCSFQSGSINDNYTNVHGGGVQVAEGGFFAMNEGAVTGNYAGVTQSSNEQSDADAPALAQAVDDEEGGLGAYWSKGGGFNVDGTLFVRGGTITGNAAAEYGNGICLNKHMYNSARLSLSGSPLLANNYAPWNSRARDEMRYEDIFIYAESYGKGDEHQIVEVADSFTPPQPVCISKNEGLLTDPLTFTPLVGDGDYEIGAFVTSQVYRDWYKPGYPPENYVLVKKDNGILYAYVHTHDWIVGDSQEYDKYLEINCRDKECPFATQPVVLEMKVDYLDAAEGEARAIAHIERSNMSPDLDIEESSIAYYKDDDGSSERVLLDGPPSEPGSYYAVSHITIAGTIHKDLSVIFWLASTDNSKFGEEEDQNAGRQPQPNTPSYTQGGSSGQASGQESQGQKRTSAAKLPQTSDVPPKHAGALALAGAAALLGALATRRRKSAA